MTMIRALRDQFETRVLASEDYRALVALDAQIAALDIECLQTSDGPDRRRLRLVPREGSRPLTGAVDRTQADF